DGVGHPDHDVVVPGEHGWREGQRGAEGVAEQVAKQSGLSGPLGVPGAGWRWGVGGGGGVVSGGTGVGGRVIGGLLGREGGVQGGESSTRLCLLLDRGGGL